MLTVGWGVPREDDGKMKCGWVTKVVKDLGGREKSPELKTKPLIRPGTLPQPLAGRKAQRLPVSLLSTWHGQSFLYQWESCAGFDQIPMKHIASKILTNAKNKIHTLEDLYEPLAIPNQTLRTADMDHLLPIQPLGISVFTNRPGLFTSDPRSIRHMVAHRAACNTLVFSWKPAANSVRPHLQPHLTFTYAVHNYWLLQQAGRNEHLRIERPVQPKRGSLLFLPNKSHSHGSFDFVFQNDDNFLNIIYEAYLFSMTQAAMKKTTWKQSIFKVLRLKVLSC